MKNNTSLKVQAAILASSGIITKIIGFLYRIPMANILGNEGNGIYSVAFGIYSIALTLSSYSMPVSISKLLSQMNNKDDVEKSKVFIVSVLLSMVLGMVAFCGLFFGAEGLAAQFGKPGIQISLKILAPTTVIVALLGCLRGYFQGYDNMLPTAISQIIEQIINAVVSVVGAGQLIYFIKSDDGTAAVRSAGGTLGTLMGAVFALVFLIMFFSIHVGVKSLKIKIVKRDILVIGKVLLMLMLPIIFSQTIYQIGYTIDDLLFANILLSNGINNRVVTEMQGVINTQYTQIINMPVGVATAFGVAVIPRISGAFARKDKETLNQNINQIIGMTSFVIFPATLGLSICSDEIMQVLFPNLNEYHLMASKLLSYGAVSVVLYAFSTITTSILQGCNKLVITVRNGLISLTIHIVIVSLLLSFTNLNVYALLIADILFPFVILTLNLIYLKNKMEIKCIKIDIIKKHLLSALIMTAVLTILKNCIDDTFGSIYKLILEVTVGVGIYLLSEIWLNKHGRRAK